MGRGEILLAKNDLKAAAEAFRKVVSSNATGEFASADPQLRRRTIICRSIAATQGAPGDRGDRAGGRAQNRSNRRRRVVSVGHGATEARCGRAGGASLPQRPELRADGLV